MPVLFRRQTPEAPAQGFEIRRDGETLYIIVRRSSSAQRYTLRVRSATRDVVLTLPKRSSLASARLFVERHLPWIDNRLDRLPQPVPFGDGHQIPLRGIPHRIVHCPQARGVVWTDLEVAVPRLLVAGDSAHIARRVRDYLRRQARGDLHAAVSAHAGKLALPLPKITLRDTTSRWGSCSAAGDLNFSWRLILAPPFVLDYLAAHEVGHLVHMNHSDAFWSVVRKLSADTERAEHWLKHNGAGLHRYGAGE